MVLQFFLSIQMKKISVPCSSSYQCFESAVKEKMVAGCSESK